MKPEAPRRPWCFGVDRSFDTNRFATVFQAQAYLGVLPGGGLPDEAMARDRDSVLAETGAPVLQGGVAA
jgi:hypothetical protein